MDDSATIVLMDPFGQADHAINAFEKATGLHIAIHVHDHKLWPMLPERCQAHTTPVCQSFKQLHHETCMAFDQRAVQRHLQDQPEGFVKICPAGLVEWVAPVYAHDEARSHRLTLFAGQALATGDLADGRSKPFSSGIKLPQWQGAAVQALPRVDEARSQLWQELLNQLAARLEQWLARLEGMTPWHHGPINPVQRKRWIMSYIQAHHTQPITLEDLARKLNLSDSRTAHLVKQIFNQSFGQLLTHTRVQTAANLLTYTNLPILDVALASGFGDVTNFHRQFRRQMHTSPLQFRKMAPPSRSAFDQV